MPGSLITGDIPYRFLGGGKPTLACTVDEFLKSSPQSEDFHCSSLVFGGSIDAAKLPLDQNLGITNAWSMMLWVVPTQLNPPDTETLFEIHKFDPVDDDDSFRIDIEPGGTISFQLFSSSGALIKRFDIDSSESATSDIDGWFFGTDWNQIFVTWDGTNMLMYRNGYLMNSDMTVISDVPGSQANSLRSISLGAKVSDADFMTGSIHSAAYWSEALDQDAIRQIWNQGSGATFNLQIGVEDYSDPRNLEGWWKLGKNVVSPVQDSTNNSRHLAVFKVEETLQTGTLAAFGGATIPAGFLLCDGSAVSRTTFAALFAVIGTSYGVGDGATTFNLPNLEGRLPQGKDSGDTDFDTLGETGGTKATLLTADQVPVHKHILRGSGGGAFSPLTNEGPDSSTGPGIGTIIPSASSDRGVQENTGVDNTTISSNNTHSNLAPYSVTNYIVKT